MGNWNVIRFSQRNNWLGQSEPVDIGVQKNSRGVGSGETPGDLGNRSGELPGIATWPVKIERLRDRPYLDASDV